MTTDDDTPIADATKNSGKPGMNWRLRLAGLLLLTQGALMEGGVFIGFLVLTALGLSQNEAGAHFEFIVPFFQDHLYLMMVMSGIFGALRVVGAVGVLRNRMWGLSLSIINCVSTLILMMFMLPAGLADGLLSGTALVLLLMVVHKGKSIE